MSHKLINWKVLLIIAFVVVGILDYFCIKALWEATEEEQSRIERRTK